MLHHPGLTLVLPGYDIWLARISKPQRILVRAYFCPMCEFLFPNPGIFEAATRLTNLGKRLKRVGSPPYTAVPLKHL